MKSGEKLIVISALLFVSIALFFCLAAAPASSQQSPIVIGVLFDGSGGAAFYSGHVMGADVAVDEVNKGGGSWGGR